MILILSDVISTVRGAKKASREQGENEEPDVSAPSVSTGCPGCRIEGAILPQRGAFPVLIYKGLRIAKIVRLLRSPLAAKSQLSLPHVADPSPPYNSANTSYNQPVFADYARAGNSRLANEPHEANHQT